MALPQRLISLQCPLVDLGLPFFITSLRDADWQSGLNPKCDCSGSKKLRKIYVKSAVKCSSQNSASKNDVTNLIIEESVITVLLAYGWKKCKYLEVILVDLPLGQNELISSVYLKVPGNHSAKHEVFTSDDTHNSYCRSVWAASCPGYKWNPQDILVLGTSAIVRRLPAPWLLWLLCWHLRDFFCFLSFVWCALGLWEQEQFTASSLPMARQTQKHASNSCRLLMSGW